MQTKSRDIKGRKLFKKPSSTFLSKNLPKNYLKTFEIFISVFPTLYNTCQNSSNFGFMRLFFRKSITVSSTHTTIVFRRSGIYLWDSSLDAYVPPKISLMTNSASRVLTIPNLRSFPLTSSFMFLL